MFSLNNTTSIFSGFFTGEGVPLIHLTGLTQAYKSIICLKATFRLLIPPPTGVVSGPLIEIRYSLITSVVSCGNHSFVISNAFSPAYTSAHAIFFDPLKAFSTAASKTLTDAAHRSGPIPSPSIKVTIGLSGIL